MYIDKVYFNNWNQINIKNKNLPVSNFADISNRISFGSNFDSDITEFSTKIEQRKKEKNLLDKLVEKFARFIGAYPQKKQYPLNIEYKEAKTLKEAIEFGQQTFGIKKYKGFEEKDLDVVNWINEGLVNCSNASKGSLAMPKKVEFKELDNAGAQISGFDNLYVDKKDINMLKLIAFTQTGNKMTIKKAREWATDLVSHSNKEFESYMSIFSLIEHEMGHLQHQANLESLFGALVIVSDKTLQNIRIVRSFINDKYAEEMQEDFKNSTKIAKKVSSYAAISPMEFVAECYAKMVDSIKLDDDVMKLYIKLGGVII